MQFDDKKLELESINDLIQCPVHTVKPYTLMLAPVYILMKLNQKLVSVKAPLDFFTPDELEKLKAHETFYLPKFVKIPVRFQTAARLVHKLFHMLQDPLEPAPYELSKEIFTVLGPLWGSQVKIEPFFMSVFADELCGSLNPEKMVWARENKVTSHDHGLLLSGTFIFLSLHLGLLDLKKINEIRKFIYEKTTEGCDWSQPTNETELIVCELNQMLHSYPYISLDVLQESKSEWAKKLLSRLELLIENKFASRYESVSISGPEGFAA